jgi:hypothetical protein
MGCKSGRDARGDFTTLRSLVAEKAIKLLKVHGAAGMTAERVVGCVMNLVRCKVCAGRMVRLVLSRSRR